MKKGLIIIICVLFTGVVTAQKNLIVNGGFEEELFAWNAGNAKATTWVQHSGKSALALVTYLKGKWEGVDQKVKLPKNTAAITISGFYKTDEIEQGANTWNVGVILIEFSMGDKKIGEAIPVLEVKGTNDWTAFEKKMAIPEKATGFRLMIALSEASGSLFADDIAVKVSQVEQLNN